MAGNGTNGNGGMNREDADLADAVWSLVDTLKVEIIKLEGLGQAITHSRVVPSANKQWKRQFAASIRQMGNRHLQIADRIEAKAG